MSELLLPGIPRVMLRLARKGFDRRPNLGENKAKILVGTSGFRLLKAPSSNRNKRVSHTAEESGIRPPEPFEGTLIKDRSFLGHRRVAAQKSCWENSPGEVAPERPRVPRLQQHPQQWQRLGQVRTRGCGLVTQCHSSRDVSESTADVIAARAPGQLQ